MKKITTFFISCLLMICFAKAQYVNIPDSNFRNFLISLNLFGPQGSPFNAAEQMDTTNNGVTTLHGMFCDSRNIHNLDGVQYFKSLIFLHCQNNQLTSIPILSSILTELTCNNNQLTNLPSLPNTLTSLTCNNNQLDSLPTLPNSLSDLSCSNNLLTSLPTLPNSLKGLNCSSNQLTNFPTLPNSLQGLNCSNDQLDSLPTLPNSLQRLYCDYNNLPNIQHLPNSLIYLSCIKTKQINLSTLPVSLRELHCDSNQISSLPILPDTLNILYCTGNNSLKCIPKLPGNLYILAIDKNNIYCLPNYINGLHVTNNGNDTLNIPICNSINNPNSCTIYNNYVNIPDSNFAKCLMNQTTAYLYKDSANQYWMDTISSGTFGYPSYVPTLNCNNLNIKNLEGIEYFKNIWYISCDSNQLVSIPDLTRLQHLSSLSCKNNMLTSLPLYNNGIYSLDFSHNNISVLPDLSKFRSYYYLNCANNLITTIPSSFSNVNFQYFICDSNNISNIPSFYPDSLVYSSDTAYFYANGNVNLSCLPHLPNYIISVKVKRTAITCLPNIPIPIKSKFICSPTNIPVCNTTNNTNGCSVNGLRNNYVNIPDSNFAQYLISQIPSCLYKDSSNKYWMDTTCSGLLSIVNIGLSNYPVKDITGIQYFSNLLTLVCDSTLLETLPQLPGSVQEIWIENNPLTNITAPFPNSLMAIYIVNSQLTSLPDIPKNLNTLSILGTPDLHCLPDIPNNPGLTIFLDTISIHCLPNFYSGLNVTDSSNHPVNLPVCNATNNPNSCTVYNTNNYVNIPDSNFAKYLITQIPSCLYKDSSNKYWMDTTCSGVVNTPYLNVSANYIKDLKGIQYFKNLKHLYCDDNLLTNLPTLPDSITSLSCSYNKIDSIYNLPNSIVYLFCDNNTLTNITNLPNFLTSLYCDNNVLISLPTLPTTLTTLNCNDNLLKSLPTLPNNLNSLSCSYNQLSSLPTLGNSLFNLYCDNNQLSSLPTLNNPLFYLDCGNNQLNSIPALPDSLRYFFCADNQLTKIPVLPDSLHELFCNNNQLTSLPALPDSLNQICCYGNINLHCLPKLPGNLNYLNIDSANVLCIPNYVPGLNIYSSGGLLNMPLCNPTNNSNQCQPFPIVHGSVFTDDNSNGTKDTNEYYRPFVQLNLSNGTSVITNSNGEYKLNLTDTGTYTLTTVAPIGFKAVPASFNFTFNNNNASLTLPDIALQPLGLTDSLSIFVTPWTGTNTKPASQVQYFVSYENVGYYYNIADTIKLTYDTSKLHFDSCSIPVVGQYGNTIIASVDSLFPGIYKYCWVYFSVKTSVMSGDSILANATVSSQYSTDTSFCQVNVLASYDPNSKEATPVLSPAQVANGTFIDYTIHFQNTGTDTAYNIVLADTLSPLLQNNILQVVATSHPCNITLKDSIIYFEFLKVNLPDSNTNQFRSNGFVHFKLKPVANVPVGSTIYNKASVYFDYNKPMVTNTAGTFITPFGLPEMMGNYTVSLSYAKDNNIIGVVNIWNTVTEINTAYYNIQRSTDASNFITTGKVTAKGASSYSFTDSLTIHDSRLTIIYYRLQIIDKNGKISYSETKTITIQPKYINVSIYPNPAKNYIIVKGSNITQINILDNTGRIVLNKTGLNTNAVENKLNINLSSGIYMVQIIQTNGNKVNEIFIVE